MLCTANWIVHFIVRADVGLATWKQRTWRWNPL